MLHALTLTILAGLSTGIGGLVAALFRPGRRAMALCGGFAAGVMLAMCLLDLIPHALEGYRPAMGSLGAGLAVTSLVLLGMGVAALLEQLLPRAKTGKSDGGRASAMRGALVRPVWRCWRIICRKARSPPVCRSGRPGGGLCG